MPNTNQQDNILNQDPLEQKNESSQTQPSAQSSGQQESQSMQGGIDSASNNNVSSIEDHRGGARGTAAMDPATRQEVARKGGLAVSRNRQHMAEIGRKGGQSVSKNRDHMAKIGRKGGAASRGQRSS